MPSQCMEPWTRWHTSHRKLWRPEYSRNDQRWGLFRKAQLRLPIQIKWVVGILENFDKANSVRGLLLKMWSLQKAVVWGQQKKNFAIRRKLNCKCRYRMYWRLDAVEHFLLPFRFTVWRVFLEGCQQRLYKQPSVYQRPNIPSQDPDQTRTGNMFCQNLMSHTVRNTFKGIWIHKISSSEMMRSWNACTLCTT
jgi:hypothetical protein